MILRLAQVFSVVGVVYVALVTPGSMYHRSAQPPPWPLQRRIAEATAGWYAAAPQLLAVDAVPTGPVPDGGVAVDAGPPSDARVGVDARPGADARPSGGDAGRPRTAMRQPATGRTGEMDHQQY